jgi:hypothetical protein
MARKNGEPGAHVRLGKIPNLDLTVAKLSRSVWYGVWVHAVCEPQVRHRSSKDLPHHPRKGKPVVRRGRKAMGPATFQVAGSPGCRKGGNAPCGSTPNVRGRAQWRGQLSLYEDESSRVPTTALPLAHPSASRRRFRARPRSPAISPPTRSSPSLILLPCARISGGSSSGSAAQAAIPR